MPFRNREVVSASRRLGESLGKDIEYTAKTFDFLKRIGMSASEKLNQKLSIHNVAEDFYKNSARYRYTGTPNLELLTEDDYYPDIEFPTTKPIRILDIAQASDGWYGILTTCVTALNNYDTTFYATRDFKSFRQSCKIIHSGHYAISAKLFPDPDNGFSASFLLFHPDDGIARNSYINGLTFKNKGEVSLTIIDDVARGFLQIPDYDGPHYPRLVELGPTQILIYVSNTPDSGVYKTIPFDGAEFVGTTMTTRFEDIVGIYSGQDLVSIYMIALNQATTKVSNKIWGFTDINQSEIKFHSVSIPDFPSTFDVDWNYSANLYTIGGNIYAVFCGDTPAKAYRLKLKDSFDSDLNHIYWEFDTETINIGENCHGAIPFDQRILFHTNRGLELYNCMTKAITVKEIQYITTETAPCAMGITPYGDLFMGIRLRAIENSKYIANQIALHYDDMPIRPGVLSDQVMTSPYINPMKGGRRPLRDYRGWNAYKLDRFDDIVDIIYVDTYRESQGYGLYVCLLKTGELMNIRVYPDGRYPQTDFYTEIEGLDKGHGLLYQISGSIYFTDQFNAYVIDPRSKTYRKSTDIHAIPNDFMGHIIKYGQIANYKYHYIDDTHILYVQNNSATQSTSGIIERYSGTYFSDMDFTSRIKIQMVMDLRVEIYHQSDNTIQYWISCKEFDGTPKLVVRTDFDFTGDVVYNSWNEFVTAYPNQFNFNSIAIESGAVVPRGRFECDDEIYYGFGTIIAEGSDGEMHYINNTVHDIAVPGCVVRENSEAVNIGLYGFDFKNHVLYGCTGIVYNGAARKQVQVRRGVFTTPADTSGDIVLPVSKNCLALVWYSKDLTQCEYLILPNQFANKSAQFNPYMSLVNHIWDNILTNDNGIGINTVTNERKVISPGMITEVPGTNAIQIHLENTALDELPTGTEIDYFAFELM